MIAQVSLGSLHGLRSLRRFLDRLNPPAVALTLYAISPSVADSPNGEAAFLGFYDGHHGENVPRTEGISNPILAAAAVIGTFPKDFLNYFNFFNSTSVHADSRPAVAARTCFTKPGATGS